MFKPLHSLSSSDSFISERKLLFFKPHLENKFQMENTKDSWQVIYTKPRHEKKVIEHLEQLNVQHFLPTTQTMRIYQGKKRFVSMPLFPSYVFVKVENTKQYLESLHVPGVLKYLKTGKQISTISDLTINKLKGIHLHDLKDVQVSSDYFNPGRIMNIHSGPFAGFSCEVVEDKGRNKILVRIELLHRNILVDLPEEYLFPYSTAQ
jgi:transcriptional antiterminator RfaH